MSSYVVFLDGASGGRTGEEGFYKQLSRLFTSGFPLDFSATSLQASQRGSGADNSVDLAIGDVGIPKSGFTYWGWTDAVTNVTATAADAANPRNSIVVAYIDITAGSSTLSNNPGALKFKVVDGTPAASPSDPSDSTIQTAVGASNPWKKIARIVRPANTPTILTSYLTDLRIATAFVGKLRGGSNNTSGHTIPNVADDTLGLLGTAQTWTAANIFKTGTDIGGPFVSYSVALTSTGTTPNILAGGSPGTLVGYYQQIGKRVRGKIALTFGASSTGGTGEYIFSLPVTASSNAMISLVSVIGEAAMFDSSASQLYTGRVYYINPTTMKIRYNHITSGGATGVIENNTFVAQADPFIGGIASGDAITLMFEYEAA